MREKRKDRGDLDGTEGSDRKSMATSARSPRWGSEDDGHVKGVEGREIQAGENKERKRAHKRGKQSGEARVVGVTERRIG